MKHDCDILGHCPHNAEGGYDCRNYCGLGVDECGTDDEEDEDYTTEMVYLISGWDDKGNQVVQYHYGYTQEDAENAFLLHNKGGEVNEILDVIDVKSYDSIM